MKLDQRILDRLNKPGEVTDDNFDALIADGAVVVDFWADYCGPCHMVMPLVYKLAHEYAGRVTVLKMDTEQHKAAFKRFNLRGVPTLLFFLNGEKIDEQLGYGGYEELRERFEALCGAAGQVCETDTRELAFQAAIEAAEAEYEKATEPAAAAYQAAAAPFRPDYQAAVEHAQAEHKDGRLDDAGLRAAYEAAYAPIREGTKIEYEAYRAAADAAGDVRYAAIGAAIEAYLG